MKPKAVVAMSGGVDSSVAAALMKDAGYDVIGIMLKLWRGPAANNESGCCSLDAVEDARRVAQVIDIPFYVFNFADKFSETVINRFVQEYARGRTPNPCVECNRSIKFAALLERASAFGASVLATGHYARVRSESERFTLRRGIDDKKDQSYVLYMLDQRELSIARFPVGEYRKQEVREIASSHGLRTAAKQESQEICFVPNGDSHAFLETALPEASRPGAVLLPTGERVGTHRGFAHYTLGQRRGIGVGLGVPVYVREIRPDRNEVVVDSGLNLRTREVGVGDVSFVSGAAPDEFRASIMTRYRGGEAEATVVRENEVWTARFDEPQGVVSPGQAAVFYRGEEVLGGGTVVATR